jgi:hypothetical protein
MRNSKAIPFYLSRKAIIVRFINRIMTLLRNIKVVAALFVYR